VGEHEPLLFKVGDPVAAQSVSWPGWRPGKIVEVDDKPTSFPYLFRPDDGGSPDILMMRHEVRPAPVSGGSPDAEPYQPSNGSEGDVFAERWCERCVKDDPEAERFCEIRTETFVYDIADPNYPRAWVYRDGVPTCTEFVPRVAGGSPDAGDSPSFANDLMAASIWLGEPVPPEADEAITRAVLPAEDREACFLAALESDETGEMLALVRHLKSLPLPRVERAINILTGGADPAEVEAAREHAKGCKVAKCIKCGRGIL
jgi:hypothetical protein